MCVYFVMKEDKKKISLNQRKSISFIDSLELTLSQIFCERHFRNKEQLYIISDYSGDRKEDNFNVHSFLITDDIEISQHTFRMEKFRQAEDVPTNSFFDYKKIWRDKKTMRLLPKYLKLVDEIDGLLLVFLIDKKLNVEWYKYELIKIFEDKGLGKWKPHILRKLIETSSILSFICSKVVSKYRRIYWLTDEDARIGYNNHQRDGFKRIIKAFFKYFKITYGLEIFSQADSESDEFRYDRDMKSIVDLSAGSLLDVIDKPEKVRPVSLDYLKWFSTEPGKLVKRNMQFLKVDDCLKVIEIKYRQ